MEDKYIAHLRFIVIFSVIWRGFKFMKVLTQKDTIVIFLVVLLTKLFLLMIGLLSQILFLGVKTVPMNSLNQFLKSMNTVKK